MKMTDTSGFHSFDGFDELMQYLDECSGKVDEASIEKVLEAGASDFVNDLLKLPRPMSNIRKPGYTHLIKTFSYRKNKGQVEVGWGKYYGRMVESGTVKTKAHPHMNTLFEKNKEKYFTTMTKAIGL